MSKFYTLSYAAGLIRTNKFNEKSDAICVATFRAQDLKYPIKIYEHDEEMNRECVLICNPDGSVEKPKGAGLVLVDLGNSSGFENKNQAHILLSNYEDETKLTTFFLKTAVSEAQVQGIESSTGVDIGMYDEHTLHAYTDDSSKIKAIEDKLCEAGLEIDSYAEASLGKHKALGSLVTAARKGHKMARANRMPELRVRSNNKFGGGFKFHGYCEMKESDGKKPPMIAVYCDGSKVGEVKSERDAARLISESAEKAFSKFLKKELG